MKLDLSPKKRSCQRNYQIVYYTRRGYIMKICPNIEHIFRSKPDKQYTRRITDYAQITEFRIERRLNKRLHRSSIPPPAALKCPTGAVKGSIVVGHIYKCSGVIRATADVRINHIVH